jgi:hypothetical protein
MLSRSLVRNKNLGFCPIPWHPVCPVSGTDLKSNTVQLKLLCLVPYILAD